MYTPVYHTNVVDVQPLLCGINHSAKSKVGLHHYWSSASAALTAVQQGTLALQVFTIRQAAPGYLTDMPPVSIYVICSCLSSAAHGSLVISRVRMIRCIDRSFAASDPNLWISLLLTVTVHGPLLTLSSVHSWRPCYSAEPMKRTTVPPLWHWQNIDYKLAVLVHKALHDQLPQHLAEDCQLLTDIGRRSLRSADVLTCATKRTRTRLGDRSFSVAGLCLRNSACRIMWQRYLTGIVWETFEDTLVCVGQGCST